MTAQQLLQRQSVRKAFFILLIFLPLSGCTDAVRLRDAHTGQVAQCGPYASDMLVGGDTQAQREAECIRDFQRQGYERMP